MNKIRQFLSSIEPAVTLILIVVLILVGVLGYAIWRDHQDKVVSNQISQPVQQSTTSESNPTQSESQGGNTEFGSGGGMGLAVPSGN